MRTSRRLPSTQTPPKAAHSTQSRADEDEDELDRAEQLKEIAAGLYKKRAQLLATARRMLAEDMELPSDDLFDEVDLASTESLLAFEHRLRGREYFLLHKIERALSKFERGTFGECEECEEPISIGRLRARPEAQLCVACKEDQENEEHQYAE